VTPWCAGTAFCGIIYSMHKQNGNLKKKIERKETIHHVASAAHQSFWAPISYFLGIFFLVSS
jgi:hypothetical protein